MSVIMSMIPKAQPYEIKKHRFQTTRQALHKLFGKKKSHSLKEEKDSFHFSVQPAKTIVETPMGHISRVRRNETLTTDSMFDCSTFVLLKGFDPVKNIYTDRVMIHLIGSIIHENYGINKLVDEAKQANGPVKMIIAFGANVVTPYAHESVIEQSSEGRTPFAELKALCGENYEEYQIDSGAQSFDVTPEGKATIRYPAT